MIRQTITTSHHIHLLHCRRWIIIFIFCFDLSQTQRQHTFARIFRQFSPINCKKLISIETLQIRLEQETFLQFSFQRKRFALGFQIKETSCSIFFYNIFDKTKEVHLSKCILTMPGVCFVSFLNDSIHQISLLLSYPRSRPSFIWRITQSEPKDACVDIYGTAY